MLGGYRKCKKGIGKFKNKALSFDRVSKIARGYRKCYEGIGNIRRVSEILGGYRKCTKSIRKF